MGVNGCLWRLFFWNKYWFANRSQFDPLNCHHTVYLIVDVADGLWQPGPTLQPIEGDTVTWTCSANKIEFFSPQMYWVHDNSHVLLFNKSRTTLYSSRYVLKRVLGFFAVTYWVWDCFHWCNPLNENSFMEHNNTMLALSELSPTCP